MNVLLGLGNPGSEYERTRHNVGFLVLDELARQQGVTFTSKRSLEAEVTEILLNETRVLLAKPQTFMNASGRTLSSILSKYPVSPEDVLVVYDDADLPFSDIRLRTSGGSAGHRGMESLLSVLPKGTGLTRMRIGIGRPSHPDIPLDEFVLGRWTPAEEEALPTIFATAIQLIEQELTGL
ncbi:aminoacyl-tRNA hydrolase [Candidatus Uhrbacteria bacterium CG10_big_fil_rev_8_21_14_0_10_48_16]|uniref:Peptidyl-tRNA hydrolase n=1 Tax=Candidatus Uhrbacteria bacterium CG10_big_fil_rev_8_21_14_0_10_48_16 TaxID=1975038 RepID=A0A2M8LGZ6_9BACT|nr:MAG: aminoacyl-tRNA hydrolase [Candidatus Uhrbacteria bacterium CG10_big_fil_rev_8_21_14_0_10_48_16]